MSTLAAFNSQYTPLLAKLCVDVCTDCEKPCRTYAEHHAVRKACADACLATIAQAKLMAACRRRAIVGPTASTR